MKRVLGTSLLVAVVLATLTACGSNDPTAQSNSSEESSQPGGSDGTIIVFAAASLKATFTEIGALFEDAHEGSTVAFNFAGSSDLVAQLAQGAPADVFASADTNNMVRATEEGLVSGDPVGFAANTLTIVTESGNPRGINAFADLVRPDLSVVVCAPQVPCGAATTRVEDSTGTDIAPVSEESSVTDVLGKVTSGQADAGLVYVTDATAAGEQVTVVPFPEASDAVNTYPISVLEQAQNPELAREFRDFVTGPEGLKVLGEAGFAIP